ncbi:AcrZ family multidrug efflux pump-associated protein [Salmonella enterica]|nr:AcrZ family multidrug efflux pump-associated protein [Salmonella enterica]
MMGPVVMAIIRGLIYGLGEVLNIFSGIGQKDQSRQNR